MTLVTICNAKGDWLGKVYEDVYAEEHTYLCRVGDEAFLRPIEACNASVSGIYFSSEQAVVDAFVLYNTAEDAKRALERELQAKSHRYVWDNGVLRKV